MENLFELSPALLAVTPIVLGLVQVAKGLGLPNRFAPLASILIACGIILVTGAVWETVVIGGIVVGLTSSGLYSGSRAVAGY